MKNAILIYLIIVIMAGTLLTACGKTSKQEAERVKQELMKAKADEIAQWQKFETDTDVKIKASRDMIAAFKEKIGKTDAKPVAKSNK